MKALKFTAIALATLASTAAMANSDVIVKTVKPAAFSVDVGTMGVGGSIAWGVNESVELQAGWSGGNLSPSFNVDNPLVDRLAETDIKGTAKANFKSNTPYVGVNVRPFKGAFTVGAGVMAPKVDFNFDYETAADATTVNINGVEGTLYKGDKVNFTTTNKNTLAPYVTVGFRPSISSRVGLIAEVGAAYTDGFESKVTLTPDASKAASAAEYKKQEDAINAKLQSKQAKWYPIAKVGATIRF